MLNDETMLLYHALRYEQGHDRRTQHILKVYALAKLLGELESLSVEEQQILQAAAILHDIAIRRCKERYSGDASQSRQKQEAPELVRQFLVEARYLPSFVPRVLELVLRHHDYDGPKDSLLQLLIEADLIVNCYEAQPPQEQWDKIGRIFRSAGGKELYTLWLENRKGGR